MPNSKLLNPPPPCLTTMTTTLQQHWCLQRPVEPLTWLQEGAWIFSQLLCQLCLWRRQGQLRARRVGKGPPERKRECKLHKFVHDAEGLFLVRGWRGSGWCGEGRRGRGKENWSAQER